MEKNKTVLNILFENLENKLPDLLSSIDKEHFLAKEKEQLKESYVEGSDVGYYAGSNNGYPEDDTDFEAWFLNNFTS